MFERFTERARGVIVLAQGEVESLRHDYLGTEHLLLGLLREEDGVAAQALYASGVTFDSAREQVESIVGYGRGATGQAPFTSRSKNVVEASLKEALGLGHNYIGTEHLLLGLLKEPEGVAAEVLSNLGVEPLLVRREVMKRVDRTSWLQGGGSRGPLQRAREVIRKSLRRNAREDRPSFDKFTGRARRVMMLAREEARRLDHAYIGTEHLLLGLIRENGVSARVLEEVGLRLHEAREQVERIVGSVDINKEVGYEQLPFTPRANKVLELAERESPQLGHDRISAEHIALGLVRESEGVAARVLSNLDVDPDAVRREVIRRLPGRGDEFDSLDEVEREMEEEEHRILFRGRVTGIRATASPLGLLSIDVDYSYRSRGDATAAPATVDPADIASVTLAHLQETPIDSLEAAVWVAGTRLMETLDPILDITVSATSRPEPVDPSLPASSVSATFRR